MQMNVWGGTPTWMRLVCASVKKCSQITDIQGDLKTNSCKGSSTSMTSVDKRLCVGSLSEAGDPSGPRAGGLGVRRFSSMERPREHQKRSELRLPRSMIGVTSTAVLTGGFVARSVKNESQHWCGVFIMPTFDVGKMKFISKHEKRTWERLGSPKEQLKVQGE